MRHFIFKILRRDEGIYQVLSVLARQGDNVAACAADLWIDVEGFPEGVDR